MNKKTIIIASISIVVLIAGVIWFLIEEDIFQGDEVKTSIKPIATKNEKVKTSENKTSMFSGLLKVFKKDKVKITANETKNIQYDMYDNGLVSMQIPKGWVVKVLPSDYVHYTFMVQNPKNENYCIFFNMKFEGYHVSQAQKNWYRSLTPAYANSIIGRTPVLNPQTTEQFYRVFNETAKLNNTTNFVFPVINNFKKVESIGKNVTGGEIIRANYTNKNGKKADGIFTVTIKSFALPPMQLLIAYNTLFFTAPNGELTEWEEVLNHCVSTIKFSNKFINGFYGQEQSIAKASADINRIGNETSNIITSGWSNRQSAYDTISQKQSDATMGYERVYDTETGDIYKADIGFTGYDWKGKYEPVTNDMYKLPTSGYIEKMN